LRAEELGVVASYSEPPTHLSFMFQINKDVDVKVGEFVEVPAGKYVLVGRIVLVRAMNQFFKNPEFIRDHIMRGLPLNARIPIDIGRWREARVEIVGMFEKDNLHPPNIPPEPGERVYRASPAILKKLLGIKDKGLFVGVMYGNDSVKVTLDPEKLMRLHFAVFGATGSGKSYTVGVLIEELLERNYPVVIIDAHGEYNTFSTMNDEPNEIFTLQKFGLMPKKYNAIILKPKYGSKGEITLNFNDLDSETISEMAKVSPVMQDLLFLAIRNLKKKKSEITPETMIMAIQEEASKWGFQRRTQTSLIRNIMILKETGVFGEGFNPEDVVKAGTVTVIDVSIDMEENIRRIFVGSILESLFKARKEKRIPPLITIIEESHRFAPQEEDTYSKTIMRRIAREGRKFGIGLGVVSQRIVGLDKDVISQCGTKIILRIDSRTDLDYLKPYLGIASEEDIKRIPYLPTGVGMITGVATRHPILVKIRPRKSKHGGSFL